MFEKLQNVLEKKHITENIIQRSLREQEFQVVWNVIQQSRFHKLFNEIYQINKQRANRNVK